MSFLVSSRTNPKLYDKPSSHIHQAMSAPCSNLVNGFRQPFFTICKTCTAQIWQASRLSNFQNLYSSAFQYVFGCYFRRPDTKVVVGMRNLKDTFVSWYHHLNMMNKGEKISWADHFTFFMYSKSGWYYNKT